MFDTIKRYAKKAPETIYDCFYISDNDILYCEDSATDEQLNECKAAMTASLGKAPDRTVGLYYDTATGKGAYLIGLE